MLRDKYQDFLLPLPFLIADVNLATPTGREGNRMGIISAFFRIIIGIVFGIIAALALTPAAAAFTDEHGKTSSIAILAVVLISVVLAFFAPSIRRAFGRGFLLAGVSFLVLPLSVMLLSGRVASDAVSAADSVDQAPVALGAGIAGIAMTGAATFVGLVVGAVFIIIGLVLALGGRREVVIVEGRR